MGAVFWSFLTKWHPFIPATSSLGVSVYPHWLSFALSPPSPLPQLLAGKDKRHETFPPLFFLSIFDKSCEENGAGRCFFFVFVRQLPGSQNKAAPPHLRDRDHLYLKDLSSGDAIFEAPKMNVGGVHQTHHAIMHAQPAKSCSQHLISCVCFPLSFSLFHLLDCEWECIVIYRILRDFDAIQLHPFIHFKPSAVSG